VETAGSAELRRRPLGVVVSITPWNNPVFIPLGKLAPALLYGNGVLWKPAPAVHAIAERLVGMIGEAGLPAGLVGLLAGGRKAAEVAMSDPAVDAVTLTGSSLAGFSAQEICARRRIPLQAELGGNNAALVWPDAQLDTAARQIAEGAFALAGQRCTANRRVVIHHECREEFLGLLSRRTAELSWGDPRQHSTRIGPLVSSDARARIADVLARCERRGTAVTRPHYGPAPCVDGFHGRWHAPTIVHCEQPSDEVVQQETFGPVLVVQTAQNWDHAIELVNGVPQGLSAALFSSSPELAERFPDEAVAGIVKINDSTADAGVDVPFGGWKTSGIGPPEHGSCDRDFYTRPQAVYRS
jgi:acyl-CoA reductase-like NAD-dependent aldehyde dehydrogenase